MKIQGDLPQYEDTTELEYNGIFLLNKPFQRLVGTDLISPYFNYLVLVLVKVG